MAQYDNLSKEELLKLIKKQEIDLKSKKYGLVWDDEKEPEQVVLDCRDNFPILKRVKTKEIKEPKNNTQEDNILIEGDNYHALTVLNYTHQEKIDVIYIDPPYNTGNKDFKYNDCYVDKEDGYRHSKWLNFMEKRLRLAKGLLKKEGIIFISIDDNEIANLQLLCNSIFGENNKIAVLPTIMNLKGNNDEFGFSGTHEYTLVYCKDKRNVKINEFTISDDEIENWSTDEIGYYKKGANLIASGVNAPRKKRPNLFYPILIKNEMITFPKNDEISKIYDKTHKKFNDDELNKIIEKYEKLDYAVILPISNRKYMSWRWQFSTMNKLKETDILITKTLNSFSLYKKQRPSLGDLPTKKPKTIFYKPEYSSGNGTNRLKELFGNKIFNNPKPVQLIKDLISLGGDKDAVILDFMAGSGTTGDAIINLNKEDNGTRKFILCTNNENNICSEVTYPRIEKVINGYKKNGNGDLIEGLGGNLQYFKTSLLQQTKNRDQTKINLTQKCSEMLCLKENIFNVEVEEEDYKIFSSNDNKKYLCVYFNFIDESFNNFLEKIKSLNGEKIIYMFSLEDKLDSSMFKEIDNCTLEAIPKKILEVYKKLVKMNIPIRAETIFIDLDKAKKQIFEDKDKDTGAKILRVVLEKLVQKIAQKNQINILSDKGKEIKLSTLNDTLKTENVFSKLEWEENKTYLTIGNHASHGEYYEFDLTQVNKFYKHIQTLINKFNI